MNAAEINFLAFPVVAVLALAGAPFALRKAGFLWAKVVFGTLTALFAGLAVCGVVLSVQHKTGLSDLPIAWLVVPALGFALYRVSRLKAEG
ncbi:MAG: hypothetical protein HYU59_13250 [Magnetospirillum gryphiswaldense]|nr:hypothetical protein [Magnetospirillum gryphiswaldense]